MGVVGEFDLGFEGAVVAQEPLFALAGAPEEAVVEEVERRVGGVGALFAWAFCDGVGLKGLLRVHVSNVVPQRYKEVGFEDAFVAEVQVREGFGTVEVQKLHFDGGVHLHFDYVSGTKGL